MEASSTFSSDATMDVDPGMASTQEWRRPWNGVVMIWLKAYQSLLYDRTGHFRQNNFWRPQQDMSPFLPCFHQ
ncbi:unnamed protein product [Nesidiocoris tenuis]|uniref:Uncharacterized protein n=1 Tax=Nesidiocoris tenuis TaxID=355587 RepID=A0A6H5GAP7_9HEMI|nr:unnamed protein product [Nesidiocoris tenuis]